MNRLQKVSNKQAIRVFTNTLWHRTVWSDNNNKYRNTRKEMVEIILGNGYENPEILNTKKGKEKIVEMNDVMDIVIQNYNNKIECTHMIPIATLDYRALTFNTSGSKNGPISIFDKFPQLMSKHTHPLKYMKYMPHNLIIKILKNDGMLLKNINDQTHDMCIAAVNENGLSLEHAKCKTFDVCHKAVKQNAEALMYVPLCENSHINNQNADIHKLIKKINRSNKITSLVQTLIIIIALAISASYVEYTIESKEKDLL